MKDDRKKPDIGFGFLIALLLAVTMFNICIFSYIGCEMVPWLMAGGFDAVAEQPVTQPTPVPQTPPPATPAPTPPPAETSPPAEAPVSTPTGDISIGQENALGAARNYLKVMPFSYDGLIGQLEFDGYTNEDAVFAADNCGADWNEQALKDAKNYVTVTAFSHEGLVAQLEYDEYTEAQAVYAADNCGADWNEQAAKAAKNYLDVMSFSRDGLIGQLEFDGYTAEQAEYGAAANGYT